MGWFTKKPKPLRVLREHTHPVFGAMTYDSFEDMWTGRLPDTEIGFMIAEHPEGPPEYALRALEDWALHLEPRVAKARTLFPAGLGEKLVRVEIGPPERPKEVCLAFKVPGDEWAIWGVWFDGEEIVGELTRDD